MFEAVEFPACIADLDTGLANVNRNALSHLRTFQMREEYWKTLGLGEEEEYWSGVYQDAFECEASDLVLWVFILRGFG